MRRRGLPLFSVDSHRPAAEFDLLAFNLSAELVYTNLLNCVDLAGVPVRAADRGPEHPLVVAGGHCTFNPEPLADFVDCFVIGDGEEVVGEITDAVQAWKAGGRTAGSRQRLLRDLARLPGVYVPVLLRRGLRRAPTGGGDAPLPRRPRPGREADHRRSGRLALPQAAAGPDDRGRPRPAQRRDLPGLHPGLPLLPGGHDHPARPGATRRPGPRDGQRRPAPDRLRRGQPHLAVERRLLRHRRGGHAASSTTRPAAARSR